MCKVDTGNERKLLACGLNVCVNEQLPYKDSKRNRVDVKYLNKYIDTGKILHKPI